MDGDRGPEEDEDDRLGVILNAKGSGCVLSLGDGLGEG